MLIRFTRAKRGDKRDVLTCVRDDGTSTWMQERPGFVSHDLAHYVVETTFGYRRGFFGLVAHGWDFADMGTIDPATGKKRALAGAPEAPGVEYVVSLLQRERAGLLRAGDFRDALALECDAVPPQFTEERIVGARRELERLHREWDEVPAGGSLEPPFPARGLGFPVSGWFRRRGEVGGRGGAVPTAGARRGMRRSGRLPMRWLRWPMRRWPSGARGAGSRLTRTACDLAHDGAIPQGARGLRQAHQGTAVTGTPSTWCFSAKRVRRRPDGCYPARTIADRG